MRYVQGAAAIGAVCSILLPVAAHGQAGARLDPDSPAGVEYQLPLEQARKNAAGDGAGGDKPRSRGEGGRRTGAAPLFGAGIAAAKATDGAAGDRAREEAPVGGGQESGDASHGGDGRGGGDSAAGVGALKQSALPSPDEDGDSVALRIAGIALAVLLVGALIGLLLRRLLREPGG